MNPQATVLLINFLNSIGNLAAQTQAPFQVAIHHPLETSKERELAIQTIANINRAIELGLENFEKLSSRENRNNILRIVSPSNSGDEIS